MGVLTPEGEALTSKWQVLVKQLDTLRAFIGDCVQHVQSLHSRPI
jgi:hypothetical protein